MDFHADTVAELLEWFFENHTDQDIYAVPAAENPVVSQTGSVSFTQTLSGLYGIFTNLVKDAYLSVTYHTTNADYRGMPMNLLQVNVNLHYMWISGGPGQNGLCNLTFNANGQFGPTLLEYRFQGMDPVIVDKLFTLPKIQAIVTDPTGALVPNDPPLLYAMVKYLVHETDDENMAPVLEYVERFPVEYRVIFMREVLQLRPNAVSLLAFNSKLLEMAKMVF